MNKRGCAFNCGCGKSGCAEDKCAAYGIKQQIPGEAEEAAVPDMPVGGRKFRIALAGNPNCGKTTIFNLLTGARQHVGNYPGVTVERKIGHCRIGEDKIEVIDLPGIYSLSNSSPEEKVAFNELLHQDIDLILNVIDSGNPQRNLYLTTQLVELKKPMLIVFNMIDDAKSRGIDFDFKMLEHYFGAKIVTTVGSQGRGMDELRRALTEVLHNPGELTGTKISYGESTDAALDCLTEELVMLDLPIFERVPARYFAIKLLENDADTLADPDFFPVLNQAGQLRSKLTVRHGLNYETFMADRRYGMIAGACREAIKVNNDKRRQISDNIDKVITSRYLGLPIFLGIMLLVFLFTFTCAEPFVNLIGNGFDLAGESVQTYWPDNRLPFFKAMLVEGIIGGVGGVLTFLPNILFLFLGIAFLEGTGYMARAAFVMDGVMHKFGLHGKSFIPMLLGFGCSVPAVMATRTIESERDRLATIMVIPLMSCGARLPIYAMIIPAFFIECYQALILWIIYIIGVVLALAGAKLLKSTLFKGDGEIFVMELPPYRMPTLRSLIIHMWERAVMYLRKAGTLILGASIILFILNNFPQNPELSEPYDEQIAVYESGLAELAADEAANIDQINQFNAQISQLEGEKAGAKLQYSLAGRIGKGLSTVLMPIGFDWKLSSALIGAFAAKELFVAQVGILYAVTDVEGDDGVTHLQAQLRSNYTPLQGFCIMLFCLISMPCMATVAVVKRETNSWKLTLFQLGVLTLLAYIITLIVYQAGLILNIGTSILS